MSTLVFVYGSLRSGFGNHRLLAHVALLDVVKTAPRYTMVSLGGFPGVFDRGETAITGELYEVDDATLARLDQLEGHPHFYERLPVEIENHPSAVAYFLPDDYRSSLVVQSGDWAKARR